MLALIATWCDVVLAAVAGVGALVAVVIAADGVAGILVLLGMVGVVGVLVAGVVDGLFAMSAVGGAVGRGLQLCR